MNSLSWMIYWAGVCENVNGFGVGLLTVFILIGAAVCTAVVIAMKCEKEPVPSALSSTVKILWPLAIFFLLVSIFTPSKDVVYAIAASEFGEDVLKTPEASKARQALNAWLDKQIGPEKPE